MSILNRGRQSDVPSQAFGICKEQITSIFWVMSTGLCPMCQHHKVHDGIPDCVVITRKEGSVSARHMVSFQAYVVAFLTM